MGKTKKSRHRRQRRPGTAAHQKMSLEHMLDAAQGELDEFRLEEARQLLNRALELHPESVRALEMSAGLLLDISEMEAARVCLQRAVQLEPDTGATKYLSLAQLLHGREAADCYSRAVQLLSAEPAEPRRLASALCALADLHMTDLCDEPDAERHCRDFVERAISVDPASAEAHHTHASLLLVLGDQMAARDALRRSTDLWLPQYQAARQGATATDPFELCPLSYDLRLAMARSLIECCEWETAGQILEGLAEEDDQVIDTWYLLGLVALEQGDERLAEARAHLERAQHLAEQNTEQREPAIDEHVTQLLSELGPAEQNENEDEGGDDEWTDDERADMEMANGD